MAGNQLGAPGKGAARGGKGRGGKAPQGSSKLGPLTSSQANARANDQAMKKEKKRRDNGRKEKQKKAQQQFVPPGSNVLSSQSSPWEAQVPQPPSFSTFAFSPMRHSESFSHSQSLGLPFLQSLQVKTGRQTASPGAYSEDG